MGLHIASFGNATLPSLVLIHGWGMHGGVWQPVLDELAQHFHLHIVDLPGMGYSSPLAGFSVAGFEGAGMPSAACSDANMDGNFMQQDMAVAHIPYMQALVNELLRLLPVHAHLCGWSFGGQVAMQLALQHPSAVNKLVLVGCTPKFVNSVEAQATRDVGDSSAGSRTTGDWQYGMQATVFHKFAHSVSQDYQTTLLKFLTLQCMGASDARHTVKQLRASLLERPEPDAASLRLGLHSLLENDFRVLAGQISQPALVVHGDRDTLAPVAAAHWLAEHLPQARSALFTGASHAPFLSHPQQFNAALMQFLR